MFLCFLSKYFSMIIENFFFPSISETTDLISSSKMLAEYPYGMIRVTGILHALLGGAIIGVNIHAIRKTTYIYDIPLFQVSELIRESMTYLFIPMFSGGTFVSFYKKYIFVFLGVQHLPFIFC